MFQVPHSWVVQSFPTVIGASSVSRWSAWNATESLAPWERSANQVYLQLVCRTYHKTVTCIICRSETTALTFGSGTRSASASSRVTFRHGWAWLSCQKLRPIHPSTYLPHSPRHIESPSPTWAIFRSDETAAEPTPFVNRFFHWTKSIIETPKFHPLLFFVARKITFVGAGWPPYPLSRRSW